MLRTWVFIALLGAASAGHAAALDGTIVERTRACTSCHGAQGRAGPDGYYPRLAGKPVGYLYNQLLNIRDDRRHYGPMRTLLAPLTDAYLLEIAQYFSQLKIPYPAPVAPAADDAQMRRGKQLALDGDTALGLPACAQCHGKALTGTLPAVPGLLGLPRDYLNAQLGNWRARQRQAHAPDCMAQVANRLQLQDVSAVTDWLAAQPVPEGGAPQPTPSPWPAGVQPVRCGTAYPPAPQPAPASQSAQVQQGAYLAKIGNCASCHTATPGAAFAGQRPIATPFGPVYSSNITPDPGTGIGAWSGDDFWQALHHGRSRDGRLLSPAFPYTSFSHMTRADSDALLAFLKTIPPVVQPNREHGLTWPLGTQFALSMWRALYFSPQVYVPDASRSAEWNRGAYLVNGVGHCGECHTPRNRLGGSTGLELSGGLMAVGNWVAPSLRRGAEAGVTAANREASAQVLKTGLSRMGHATGPMAEVVQGGTQYLHDADLQAMLVYLGSLSQEQEPTAARGPKPVASALEPAARLYKQHCADCHGEQGDGVEGAYAALAGNRAVLAAEPNNLIYSVLHGGYSPTTTANPRPFGMPPFLLTLSDAEVAQVLTYVRQSWGNQASAVNAAQVTHARNRGGR